MKECINKECQRDVPDDYSICPYCGTELPEKDEKMMYENCQDIETCKKYIKLYPKGLFLNEIILRYYMYKAGWSLLFDKELISRYPFLIVSFAVLIYSGKTGDLAKYYRTAGGSDPDKELSEIDNMIQANISSAVISQKIQTSPLFKAIQQTITKYWNKDLIDRNIKIVFPDLVYNDL